MAFQNIFKRYELKYLLSVDQKNRILDVMKENMLPDRYGRSTIRNLYYDTNSYLLIRRSIEKPTYKEKLRIRSYQEASDESTVFVELKKKYKSVVYKRRLSLPYSNAKDWLGGKGRPDKNTQIAAEINYFLSFYQSLRPAVFLSYEREAYSAKDKSDFRITFDDNILSRQEDLSLKSEVYGTSILPEGKVLMEIKCGGGIPLWMTEILSKERIYKTSFSKYGTAYKTIIIPQNHTKNPLCTQEVYDHA